MTHTVLLAEDDEDHAFFTVRAFKDAHGSSLEITTVRDGEEAMDFLQRRGKFVDAPRPQLIVLDVKMPRCNGIEVLTLIKASPELRSIPVVMLSSSDRREDVQDSYDGGANSYVTKPATLDGLTGGVRDLAKYWLDTSTLPG